MYELLHTKPVSAWKYVTGKIVGGFTALLLPLAAMTAVFTFLCMKNGIEQGFPVAVWDLFAAECTLFPAKPAYGDLRICPDRPSF